MTVPEIEAAALRTFEPRRNKAGELVERFKGGASYRSTLTKKMRERRAQFEADALRMRGRRVATISRGASARIYDAKRGIISMNIWSRASCASVQRGNGGDFMIARPGPVTRFRLTCLHEAFHVVGARTQGIAARSVEVAAPGTTLPGTRAAGRTRFGLSHAQLPRLGERGADRTCWLAASAEILRWDGLAGRQPGRLAIEALRSLRSAIRILCVVPKRSYGSGMGWRSAWPIIWRCMRSLGRPKFTRSTTTE